MKVAPKVGMMDPEQIVRFMPCDYRPKGYGCKGLWIKYKKPDECTLETKLIFRTRSLTFLDCPDRLLLFTQSSLEANDQPRPLDLNWDKFVSMSLLHTTGTDYPFDRLMINPVSFSGADDRINLRKKANSAGLLINSDSSAFQLAQGKEEYIDPEKLAEFYTRNAHEGFTIDFPSARQPIKIARILAKLQILNSKFLKANTPRNFRLATVLHGIDIPEVERFRKLMDKLDTTTYALAGIPSAMALPPVKHIDRLVYHLSHGQQFPQYHQLGLYNLVSTTVTARLAHQLKKAGRTILFTQDNSAAQQKALSFQYNTSFAVGASRSHALGVQSPGGQAPNPYRILPCQCSVCRHIKYVDVFSHFHSETTYFNLIRHNENVFANWLQAKNVYARDLDDQQYREMVDEEFSPQSRTAIYHSLDYIDVAMQDGWKVANKRFSHMTKNLFGSDAVSLSGEAGTNRDRVRRTTERYRAIIKRYRKFHGV